MNVNNKDRSIFESVSHGAICNTARELWAEMFHWDELDRGAAMNTRITFVIGDGDRGCGGHENGGGIMISVKLIIMKIMTIYDDTQLPTIAIHCSAPSCVWRLPRWPSWPHSSWCQTLPRGQHRHHHSHNQESIHWSQTPIWKIIIMIIMILCRQCLAPLVRWTLFLARLASTILSTTRVGSWIMVPYIMT